MRARSSIVYLRNVPVIFQGHPRTENRQAELQKADWIGDWEKNGGEQGNSPGWTRSWDIGARRTPSEILTMVDYLNRSEIQSEGE
jgi:hypothetical protein